jgi:hypothetical protein
MTLLHAPSADVLDAIAHPEELDDARFDALARSVYEAQRAAIPVYDAWCAHELSRRTSPEVRGWRDIPALPVAAFKRTTVADPRAPVEVRWESSGTTAADRSQHLLGSTALYEASIDAGVAEALVPDLAAGERDRLACVQLHPAAEAASTSSLSYMYDRIRRGPWCLDEGCYVDAAFHVDGRVAWSKLEALAASHRPVLVLATSFALAMLLDRADELDWESLRLPPASRIVDTGGYKGRTRAMTRDELLERVERRLGVPPEWCEYEYGMSELSSQAWLGTVASSAGYPMQLAAPRARWTPPWLRVRVVDPATLEDVADGERGLLVFHDLANIWSCAAIRSEDIGIRHGRGFELVGRAPGATLKGCSLQLEELVELAD